MSHDIPVVNEILQLMANSCHNSVINELNGVPYYASIADETSDASNKEQFVICFRWIDEDLQVHEEAIGMYQLDLMDAAHMETVLLDVILR